MIRLALLLAALALPLEAQTVRPADRERLENFDALFGRALRDALEGGDNMADREVLIEALASPPVPLDPAGDWQCRTVKMGGILPLTVYGFFRCRITAEGPGVWRLEKLTGSQFTAGLIYDLGDEALYLGTGYVSGGPAMAYADLPPDDQTPVEPGQTTADVGFFEQTGPWTARLLLPDPVLESDFDLLILER